MMDFSRFTGFEWDRANDTKNWEKHGVSREECEQVFFNRPLLVFYDARHSGVEERHYLLGRTDRRRCLFVVFTLPPRPHPRDFCPGDDPGGKETIPWPVS
jgi:uncharacterized DUF497 family protein